MFRDAPCLVLRDIEKLTRCSLRAIPVPSATPARAMARSRDRRHQACRGKHPRGRLQQAAEPPRRDSQHDCGHGSFFRSRWANELIGSLCSLMTLTPYAFWRRQHARHHGSWNNLDRRAASGLDIYSSCLTVAEYRALGRWRRRLVRLANHPIVANLLLPPLVFVILYRVPFDAAKGWRHERLGVYLTNLALADFIGGLGLAVGYGRVAAVQLPIMVIASIVGVWLFSIQHRFEHAQWMPDASWSFAVASLGGTSYLRLPRLLQWFTGNIGFHHVHHVDPRIPNYRLEECHNADAGFQS